MKPKLMDFSDALIRIKAGAQVRRVNSGVFPDKLSPYLEFHNGELSWMNPLKDGRIYSAPALNFSIFEIMAKDWYEI